MDITVRSWCNSNPNNLASWCNGNTGDFGSLVPGSNPGEATNSKCSLIFCKRTKKNVSIFSSFYLSTDIYIKRLYEIQ